ncbi:MAG TPA: ATP-binding protein, partial [Vicinamibacterales bacterium]
INDLMLYARPRAPRLGHVELRPLIADAVTIVRRDPGAQSVEIVVEGDDVSALADDELIRATVLNLLINAAQAMGGHGQIVVTLTKSGSFATIEVRDTGPGIPPEIRAQVFEPFFTTKARGGGLGLPIARRTAELHGGSLVLDCPDSGGTVVTMRLPLRPAASEPNLGREAANVGANVVRPNLP